MSTLFPQQVTLEAHEIYEINRTRLALRLHRLPREIDAEPAKDINMLIAIMNMDASLQERKNKG